MENKEDLLNLDNNKKSPKKILIYGAAAFLVFVIAVIIFAVMGGGSSENNTVIPPQVKEEPLFKEIPIEQNNTVKTDNDNKIKTENNISKSQAQQNLTKENFKPQKEEIKEVKETRTKKIPAVQNRKTEIKKPVKKTIEKKVYAKKGKYYIQVAALMKYAKPNKKFLALIKKHGYNYKIYPVIVNREGKKVKINKLLIGPFASKNEAKKELVKIKKQITQNAFIFKVK